MPAAHTTTRRLNDTTFLDQDARQRSGSRGPASRPPGAPHKRCGGPELIPADPIRWALVVEFDSSFPSANARVPLTALGIERDDRREAGNIGIRFREHAVGDLHPHVTFDAAFSRAL